MPLRVEDCIDLRSVEARAQGCILRWFLPPKLHEWRYTNAFIIVVIIIFINIHLPMVGFDPGLVHSTVRRVTTRLLGPARIYMARTDLTADKGTTVCIESVDQ